ncbi:Bro-N domain-containing protein [Streptomyces sp. MBT97]|uniref:BRO-N domain-containing protein n=1 Tax=Streptomyces sp. MBT97 TaxID=2800411 RepID=UPI00190CD46C|nr:Bro-N domain-containing protein [Streptomyces sp. MBT97]MBK3637077.1 Bro-N domain-containing protein [Streptomyces sp. MBT97]
MYEQNSTQPPDLSAAQQDAIEISDFVYAVTGARLRRLTMPDGTHWFPAVDVCKNLGYTHVGSTLRNIADTANVDSVESVLQRHTLSIPAGREWRRDMNLVNLQGLILMVNACTKPEAQPFKIWVSEVIATIQRDGSYSLEPAAVQPAPAGGTAYVMPEQVVDALVRLEERNLRMDEELAARAGEHNDLLRQISHSLQDIAAALGRPVQSPRPVREARPSPQEILAAWKAKNLVVTDDVHAVAAVLAPALARGEARYRVEDIAARTGLSHDRVHDSLRMLLKRGCVRQTGCGADGAPLYVLP